MTRYALLCDSAPNDFRQKKLEDLHNELLKKDCKDGWHVTCFANGIDELTLEYALNNIFEGNAGDEADSVRHVNVLLYFCARCEADLNAKMADADCDVVRLGENEIRREVISYYEELSKKLELEMQVVYDVDGELVSEESLGYESVTAENAGTVQAIFGGEGL